MTNAVERLIESWLFDPMVGKLVTITIGILIVIALVRVARGVLNRYVEEPGNLYRAKKMVSFIGYFLGLSIITLIFSDHLGKMAVVFGVAGAGVAFSLQEVLACAQRTPSQEVFLQFRDATSCDRNPAVTEYMRKTSTMAPSIQVIRRLPARHHTRACPFALLLPIPSTRLIVSPCTRIENTTTA